MNSFDAKSLLYVGDREYQIFRLAALNTENRNISRLPYSIRILLENLLRCEDGINVTANDIEILANWNPLVKTHHEIAFSPARIVLQDFTGVPCLVDLAAMRDAMAAFKGDPSRINPSCPVELVIDHSIQVDVYGVANAFQKNVELDYQRNGERYAFLRWGQQAFTNFKVVPPNTGIVHQVNLEHLARVVFSTDELRGHEGTPLAYPDTCVGTDSHTPMVNGAGVLAWGVGGIEAEAAMLGQPITMLIPEVVGFRLQGRLPEGTTATDLVLTITEMLRKKGVVAKFVEFFGPGITNLSLADRATIGNMSPEYGCTCAIFPPDQVTLDYLRFTGRTEQQIALVEAYMKVQGLFHCADSLEASYSDVLELDLSNVEPCIAGPGRPQDRIRLSQAKDAFLKALPSLLPTSSPQNEASVSLQPGAKMPPGKSIIDHGSIVIAAITSCTNTSNPAVMIAAGLLAQKAVNLGLTRKPWVKTSFAPGSLVVTEYYRRAGLLTYLEQLGFYLVGYGCTTCIGNSGPLAKEISEAIQEGGLVACAVLSGNRNFEGRIHSEVRANYLMSPALVVAYAIAGHIDWDPQNEPIGINHQGRPVFLKDIWPLDEEVNSVLQSSIESEMFRDCYRRVFHGDVRWQNLDVPTGERFAWDMTSTYVRRPPYFDGMHLKAPRRVAEITGARVIALLGNSLTTDHISPAGNINRASPAGIYLARQGISEQDFNSYGSRRGNHEVMVRGTFANRRLRNQVVPEEEGGYTLHFQTGEILPIYDAAMRYLASETPLIVIAGKEYGSGSSRDWAAKGPCLQGVKAVIAESFERIHRSNLVGMGVLPLEFLPGENAQSLNITGHEILDIVGLSNAIAGNLAMREIKVRASLNGVTFCEFSARIRIDTPQEVLYFRHGGILQFVLRQLLGEHDEIEAFVNSVTTRSESSSQYDDEVVMENSMESFPASDSPGY